MNWKLAVSAATACLVAVTLASGALAVKRPPNEPSSQGLDVRFYSGQIEPWVTPDETSTPLCDEKLGTAIRFFPKGTPRHCDGDSFSAYSEGAIVGPATGTVSFCSYNDDGFALQIGEVRVIDDYGPQGAELCNATGTLEMQQNRKYPLAFWYYEGGGGNDLVLYWDPAGGSDWVLVPKENLRRN